MLHAPNSTKMMCFHFITCTMYIIFQLKKIRYSFTWMKIYNSQKKCRVANIENLNISVNGIWCRIRWNKISHSCTILASAWWILHEILLLTSTINIYSNIRWSVFRFPYHSYCQRVMIFHQNPINITFMFLHYTTKLCLFMIVGRTQHESSNLFVSRLI